MLIYAEVFGAIVRWLMTLVGGYLIAHHVLTADLNDRLTSELVKHAVLVAPVVASLSWSIVQKVRKEHGL